MSFHRELLSLLANLCNLGFRPIGLKLGTGKTLHALLLD